MRYIQLTSPLGSLKPMPIEMVFTRQVLKINELMVLKSGVKFLNFSKAYSSMPREREGFFRVPSKWENVMTTNPLDKLGILIT